MMEAELQRLFTQVTKLYEVIKDMRAEIDAERRARQIAEADNAKWIEAARRYVLAADLDTRLLTWGVLSELSLVAHPGAAILAVVDAAREAVTTQSTADLAAAIMEYDKRNRVA